MSAKRVKKHPQAKPQAVGGQWLPNLLTWGGVLLMLTGGIIAYPTLQATIAPPNAESLEFSVTLAPPAAAISVVSPIPTIEPPPPTPAASATALPPLILPETELQPTPGLPKIHGGRTTTTPDGPPAPTVEPTATPTPVPTPTPDPASMKPIQLLIPAINLDAPVVEVGWETKEVNGQTISSWIVPDSFTVGWHTNSALPGQPGNTVLNGHHNIYGEVFRDLEDLQPGDEIVLLNAAGPHYYAVTERHILKEKGETDEVRLQNASFIMPTQDERLTMVTCWPYTNNTHRLVIVAMPFQPTPTPTPIQQ